MINELVDVSGFWILHQKQCIRGRMDINVMKIWDVKPSMEREEGAGIIEVRNSKEGMGMDKKAKNENERDYWKVYFEGKDGERRREGYEEE